MSSNHLLSLWLVAAAFCFSDTDFFEEVEQEFCHTEEDCGALEGKASGNNEPHPQKWSRYLKLIDEAREHNHLISNNRKTCEDIYGDTLAGDLRVWREKGNIERKEFEQAKSLGVHYQIVDHKLYRHEKCTFGARYVCLPLEGNRSAQKCRILVLETRGLCIYLTVVVAIIFNFPAKFKTVQSYVFACKHV